MADRVPREILERMEAALSAKLGRARASLQHPRIDRKRMRHVQAEIDHTEAALEQVRQQLATYGKEAA